MTVHSAAPARTELVVAFSPQRIFGVSEAIEGDTVMPLRCVECDSNEWYRWNGRHSSLHPRRGAGIRHVATTARPRYTAGMHVERRVWAGWLLAAGVAVSTVGGLVAAQAPDPPRLLAGALRAHADWRLLDPTTDLVGDYTIQQLQELDRWPPWIEQDLDRDGHDDIAAVVVRRKAGSPTEFTVAVVHGATPEQAELVVPFSPQRIFGVSEGIRDDTVMPLHCADCESNVWYRWNGRAYEPRLHAIDEAIRIGSEPGKRSPLFASPRPDAARTAEISHCARAQVQEVGGEEGRRWYRVEVVGPQFPRGWVPAQLVMEGVECEG